MADILVAALDWKRAAEFYRLAYSVSLWGKDETIRQLAKCRRHSRDTVDDSEVYSASAERRYREPPSVAAPDLPYVWADPGRRHGCAKYLRRASEAATAINDTAMSAWARRKAQKSWSAATRFEVLIDEILSQAYLLSRPRRWSSP